MNRALTRAISPRLADAELTFLEREPIDVRRAVEQHDAYERWLERQGIELIHVEATPELPDGVFVEDAAVVLDEVAIITRPGATSRQPETESVARVLKPFRSLAYIRAPGTIDGGDVLRIGRTLYVGRSQRTNDEGISQLAAIVGTLGWEVVPVDFTGCLHLKSAATEIGDGGLLVNPGYVDAGIFGLDPIAVDPSEPFAANALRVGRTVLLPDEFPRTRAILERRGFHVETVSVSEILKAEAGVTCCSVIF